MIITFGRPKQAVIDELDTLEGVRCYNVTTKDGTRWPYVGVDGSGTFFKFFENPDSCVVHIIPPLVQPKPIGCATGSASFRVNPEFYECWCFFYQSLLF